MKSNSDKKTIIILLLIITISITIGSYLKYSKARTLNKNTNLTIGFLKNRYRGAKTGTTCDFIYLVNKSNYVITESGENDFLNLGDTVLIKYSLKDHSVAEVIDFYYMKKYKHLKN